MADIITLKAARRTEFGKGAARRLRREDRVPAVVYGREQEPIHISLEGHATLLALRAENQLLSIEIDGGEKVLALPKDVQRDILKGFVRHVDLVTVRRGEKVSVQVALRTTGEPAPGTIAMTEINEIEVMADPLNIPEEIEISVADLEAGTTITLGEISLPQGVELDADPEYPAISIVVPTYEDEEESEEGEDEEESGEGSEDGE